MNQKKDDPSRRRGDQNSKDSLCLPWLEETPTAKILVALTLLVFLAFANALQGEFVFDDSKQILNNPSLRGPVDWDKAFTTDVWAFQKSYSTDIPPPYYRPLFTLWLGLGYHLFRLWPPGWHLLSVLLHLFTVWLIYATLQRVGRGKTLPALAAGLFAVHPIHSESVAWVSAVPDVLLAVFFLPSLYAYLRARQGHGAAWWAASLILYALSTLCKENALSLPIIVFAYELWCREESSPSLHSSRMKMRKAFIRASGFILLSVLYLVVRYCVLGLITWKHPFDRDLTNFIAWISVPQVFLSYLWHLVFPFRLSLFYNVYFVRSLSSPAFWGSMLILVALFGMVWRWWSKIDENLRRVSFPVVLFGLLVWFCPMLPILNLKALNEEYLVQDRYMYLPSVGFCTLAAFVLLGMRRSRLPKSLQASVIGAVMVFLLACSIWQNTVWATSISLWTRAESYRPGSWSGHYNLGLALLNHHRYLEAEAELKTAAELNTQRAIVFNNLGLVQTELSKDGDARTNFEKAIHLDPRLVEAYVNLGALEYRMGQAVSARQNFQEALALNPKLPAALYNLARIDMDQGNYVVALTTWERLLQLNPQDADARWELGITLKGLNRPEEARRQWRKALQDAGDETMRQKILSSLRQ